MMKFKSMFLTAMLVGGCTTVSPLPAPPATVAGNWHASNGLDLAISQFSSFAVRHGCTISGGMLKPLGDGRYRIERYETGFASDRCGPWRSGPEIAPFNETEVRIDRAGPNLIASGGRWRVVMRWLGSGTV